MTIGSRFRAASFILASVLAAACSSASNDVVSSHVDASTPVDGSDAAVDDAATSGEDGGQPARNSTCTPLSKQTGTAVNSDYGRLDGTLVFVVGVGQGYACNGDSSHVHLQIEVSGSVYDVAVDIGQSGDEVGLYQENISVPGGAWAEGWHSSESLSYPSLGVQSSSLPLVSPNPLGAQVESLLSGTSKISIFCTGYVQGNGCHDVHYVDGSGKDGAIVLDPTAADSPVLFFRFSSQKF